ncbi:MAG: VWA domain-containing protein [Chloroflexi bacterium]|nr:VWA domain-containing protein [Chloroflexota bacterium]
MSTRNPNTTSSNRLWTCLIVSALLLVPLLCLGAWLGYKALISPEGASIVTEGDVTLRVGYTPEKETAFREIVSRFNGSGAKTLQGRSVRVEAVSMDAERMMAAALAGEVQAISPDSAVWLTQLDASWRAQQGLAALQAGTSLVGETTRYAISPVVIAMWEDVAHSMGAPDRSIGWSDLMDRARSDPGFRWSHPSTNTASGLLATLAMFYAGSGKTRGLTQEDAQAEETLAYVSAVEKTVRYYGEGELAVIQRALTDGPKFLDAFVVQEQLVIYHNRQASGHRLVAVYPREGTLWQDHPLVLLEQPGLTSDLRQAHAALRDYLLSADAQQFFLEQGYRPADLSVRLDAPGTPFTSANGVDPSQPQTTLQIPSSAVIAVVREAWAYTKRQTNVYLVSDTSGSMADDNKIGLARQAMQTFVQQIPSDQERVGLLTFASEVQEVVPLGELGSNRAVLDGAIANLAARGNTALLDAVYAAYVKLQDLKDTERINAIVVMTDGRENRSRMQLTDLVRRIQAGNAGGVPVVIFCIAYGEDADMQMLRTIAEASGGQAREGSLETIQELYKLLSTYF